ncbi:MAG: choice-of-anchor J domain-containing protein, partial [Bacteroidales bacterium]|nr:choice-of-anchor J domain-containing protein [Bacteroidales bacterium]
INEIVIIKNVQFTLNELGGTYADGVNHIDFDRHIEDCDGNSMIVRTSGYADFANDSLPEGIGTITAVLTKYNSDYQLIIRNPKEVNMENERCGDIYYHSFYSDGLSGFTSYSVSGTQEWVYDASFGAVINGYPNANEDWLISPAIDLTSYSDVLLRFRHAQGYLYTGFENDLKVFICNDYDGVSNPNSSGSWTELTGITYSPDWWNWVESGDIDISAFNNNPHVFIAFKYKSTASKSCAWEIDNMRIHQ